MASNLELDKVEGAAAHTKLVEQQNIIVPALKSVDDVMNSMPGIWKGTSADKFLAAYNEMKNVVTKQFPEFLDEMNKNLDSRLEALQMADGD